MSMTDERKLLLLGLLRQTDMHGYQLNAHLGATMPVTLKKSTAYNLLEVMEKDGWVSHRKERTGRRVRKIYSLTRNGEAAFMELLRRQLAAFTPAEHPGMVSLGFLDALPAGEAGERLKTRRAKIRETMACFQEDPGDSLNNSRHHHGSLHLAIGYWQRALALELDFLHHLIQNLEDQ